MKPNLLVLTPLLVETQEALARHFEVHRLAGGNAIDFGNEVQALVTGGDIGLPADLAEKLPRLEIVCINGVGYDRVDLERAREKGYRVAITPNVLTADVADHAVMLVLGLTRQICRADRFVRDGDWGRGGFGLTRSIGHLKCGIFGLGRIGEAIARRLEGFGCSIAYCSRQPKPVPYEYYTDVTELAAAVDVLIVAAAATAETRHQVDAKVFDALGADGLLVNVARGSIVDQAALARYLQSGRLGGAALDVFEDEPLTDRDLIEAPNTLLTPHIASATFETRRAMGELVIANLLAHFSGQPVPGAIV